MPVQQGQTRLFSSRLASQTSRHAASATWMRAPWGKRRTVLPASWATRVVWYWYVDWMYSSLPQETWVATSQFGGGALLRVQRRVRAALAADSRSSRALVLTCM